jgi:hypothetical protein
MAHLFLCFLCRNRVQEKGVRHHSGGRGLGMSSLFSATPTLSSSTNTVRKYTPFHVIAFDASKYINEQNQFNK